ncbi:PAS domain-containing methyl-accepting chemotaxis protein [Halorhodospira neutriphila]|uniref:Methyl-accepting chemotaxis sensory transducer with Pas/Pac sensor n=1 Tax=Halorhodospira neutriphila TaxID=168379 RepID=A0ABS1E6S2_9GAMM|nr:PAS domain-containing methyl-accepting chemotaxis protein [Halorhodospira neutriphila]MBK1727205.1 hypothetical protein [Halorhodospira neutriphila]
MRSNQPVTQRRVPVSGTILSTTDPKGKITYVNDEFVRVSGFTEEELLGQPHNIIRHPDMPRQAFYEMWERLQSGRSWMGLVKNRCKSGDHYWVHAYATPIVDDQGRITEIQSVRLPPPDEATIERAEALYAQARAREPDQGKISARTARPRWQLDTRGRTIGLMLLAPLTAIAAAAAGLPAGLQIGAVAGAALAALAALPWAWRHLGEALRSAAQIVDDPIAEAVYTGRQDEAARLELALLHLRTELQAVPERLANATQHIQGAGTQAAEAIAEAREQSQRQTQETQQVATAMEEMSQSVQEVARNASQGAETSEQAREQTSHGMATVQRSADAVRELVERVKGSAEVIHQVADETERIGSALNLIQEITEQTNLLALNAAIEAARAGDVGRGFSVVAEEVRVLADRTSESTREIKGIIESLQQGASQAVAAMRESSERAEATLEYADQAREALEQIDSAVGTMREMSAQIASATEEQSATADEVNRNINNIDQLAQEVRHRTEQAGERMSDLAGEIDHASRLVGRFSQEGR